MTILDGIREGAERSMRNARLRRADGDRSQIAVAAIAALVVCALLSLVFCVTTGAAEASVIDVVASLFSTCRRDGA